MNRAFYFILRLLFNVAIIMLSISVLRVALGARPLTTSYFLDLLSDIDVNFSYTLGHIAKIADLFQTSPDVAWYEKVISWLSGIFNALVLPIKLLQDLFSFVLSVCRFVISLLGFDVFGLGDYVPSVPSGPIKPWGPDGVIPIG